MSRQPFRLASLLRLRRAQQDQAAAALALAAAERLRASERTHRASRELGSHRTPSECSATAWTASVAARAALSAALRQAEVDVVTADAEVDVATGEWQGRRRATKALEHLEGRHDEREVTRLMREEQVRLDEHTAAVSARSTKGDRS